MSRREARGGTGSRACCMVSELLEESGIDRERIRRVRRQVLQGIILLCQWQLERMDAARARTQAEQADGEAGERPRRGRTIKVQ